MAILDLLPGLQTGIDIRGQQAQEYDDDEEITAPNTVTKYIEAESGADFGIRYRFENSFDKQHDVVVRVYLDGKYADGCCVFQNQLDYDRDRYISSTRERIGDEYFESKFRFASLVTDDSDLDGSAQELQKALEGVGTIRVQFTWCTIRQLHKPHENKHNISEIGTIPEKALKGKTLSHQASLMERRPIKAFGALQVDYLWGTQPFAIFNFKYRSRAALRSLLVIPRSPTPVPFQERNVRTLSVGERSEFLQSQCERDEAARLVKREGGIKRERTLERSTNDNGTESDDEISFVSVKRCRLPVTLNNDGTETIDLT